MTESVENETLVFCSLSSVKLQLNEVNRKLKDSPKCIK